MEGQKQRIRLSIIVPVYNVEKYLRHCIDSILEQSYNNFELILVDDGSSDLSGGICDTYQSNDKRVKVIHQHNSGVSVARNKGIDNAKGEIILFIDSDDYVEKDLLWNIIQNMTEEVDILFYGLIRWRARNRIVSSVRYKDETFSINEIGVNLEKLQMGYVVGKAYRRKIIENKKIRFDENMRLGEDSLFFKECLLAVNNSIRTISYIGYNYMNCSQGSLSSSYVENIEYSYKKIYEATTKLERFHPFKNCQSLTQMITTAKINNLYAKNSTYSTSERVQLIRKWMKDEKIRSEMMNMKTKSLAYKIVKCTFKYRLPYILHLAYKIGRGK